MVFLKEWQHTMDEKSSTVAAPKAENALPLATKNRSIARSISVFKPSEIRALFASSQQAYRSSFLDIKIAPSMKSLGRVLIIIPKKVGSAPKRNLIRRRIKSIFYQHKLFQKKKDLLIFIKPGADRLAFEALTEILCNVVSH